MPRAHPALIAFFCSFWLVCRDWCHRGIDPHREQAPCIHWSVVHRWVHSGGYGRSGPFSQDTSAYGIGCGVCSYRCPLCTGIQRWGLLCGQTLPSQPISKAAAVGHLARFVSLPIGNNQKPCTSPDTQRQFYARIFEAV